MSITIEQTSISECIVIHPTIHRDERGVFSEIYKYSDLHHFKPIQSNCSISKGGVLRGIHRTPYTFFNNGPHSNFFETLEKIKSDILSIDFDIAIIACGAYAVPLCDYCHNISKIGISIGSIMHRMFGIDPDNKNSKLWINKIPTEYIPKNYEKIEKGRYWLGLNNQF